MPKGKELTFFEREKIETYLRMKKKILWIAAKLGRDYSVIRKEIKRNTGEVLPYCAVDAQSYAERRKKNTNKRKLEKYGNEKLKEYVDARLKEGWSPEEIAGRLVEHPPDEVAGCKDKTVSYESIYDYIYNGEGRFGGLYKFLRRKQCKRKKEKARKQGVKTILKERVSIHQRPEIVATRERFGKQKYFVRTARKKKQSMQTAQM
ncbi:MAG: integrase catalytic subunit [Candidatus Moranbacteria bacterium GW2011_GWE1_36_7]|nr:MAG: integrase catalytic subunit [Candidatus Moranbacteria bacterium GW2011_GWE1_36_7]